MDHRRGGNMKAQNVSRQMFGDPNKQLNQIRDKMNQELREECLDIMAEKKQEWDKDGADI